MGADTSPGIAPVSEVSTHYDSVASNSYGLVL